MSETKSSKPVFRMNTAARMHIAEPEPVAVEPPPPAEADVPLVEGRDAWNLMDNAPHDGTMVYLKIDDKTPDYIASLALWRASRMYDSEVKRWVNVGFWVDPMTRLQIPFDPFVWRLARNGMVS